MQTINGKKIVIENSLFRLNFSDTHQMKNYLNTLNIENIDGTVKHTKLHNKDIISCNLLSFFQQKAVVYKNCTQIALTFMQTMKVEKKVSNGIALEKFLSQI